MERILVIDDDKQIRDLFKRKLESLGYEVALEDDGEPGLERFIQINPDLVLLDLIMPGKEGIEVLQSMKKINPNCKVIAISAGGRGDAKDYLVFAKVLGAIEVMEKPVDLNLLESTVKRVLLSN